MLFLKIKNNGHVNTVLGPPPPRALEGVRVSEGPWSVSFISFTVYRLLDGARQRNTTTDAVPDDIKCIFSQPSSV